MTRVVKHWNRLPGEDRVPGVPGPVPGDIQGQGGWGCEQSNLAIDVPVYCRGIGLDDL